MNLVGYLLPFKAITKIDLTVYPYYTILYQHRQINKLYSRNGVNMKYYVIDTKN